MGKKEGNGKRDGPIRTTDSFYDIEWLFYDFYSESTESRPWILSYPRYLLKKKFTAVFLVNVFFLDIFKFLVACTPWSVGPSVFVIMNCNCVMM